MAKPDKTPPAAAATTSPAAPKPETPAQREKRELAEHEARLRLRRLQTEAAHAVKLDRLARKEPAVRGLIEERDALKAQVADLEAQLAKIDPK